MKLISKEYKKQLVALHDRSKAFGSRATEMEHISELIKEYNIIKFLDYGCGKGALVRELTESHPEIKISGYDPGIKKYSKSPESADLVSSTDVMEHIEPEFLDSVLKHLFDLTNIICYLEIACFPSKKTLHDGRNAHLIQENSEWWLNKLLEHWTKEQIVKFDVKKDKLGNDYKIFLLFKK